jgi:3-(3-hydroxy-phenyl)propionate hydroxylase
VLVTDVAQVEAFEVAIVGYGPVGEVLANLLGAAGLSVAVFEREAGIHHSPRAGHIDGEVMRIVQTLGLGAEVEAVTVRWKGMRFVSAQGVLLVDRPGPTAPGPQGWFDDLYFHQPDLERCLRRGVERYPNVKVSLRHDVFAIEEAPDGALLRVEDLSRGELRRVRARYVVGCDGARSLVRRLIGTRQHDYGLHQPWLVLDLIRTRPVELPEFTTQFCDPARPMTYIHPRGDRLRWEIMVMPHDDPVRMTRPEGYWPLVSRWIGPEDAQTERAVIYTFHSLVAHEWRRGRLLVAGDAAHQMPPFLGQGLCAGVRDAANLAWKLVRVVRGEAPEALLDTYGEERKAHVAAVIELAVRLGGVIQTTDPLAAARRDRVFATDGPEKVPQVRTLPIGPGLHRGDAPAGTLFPQPRLADGTRFDDAVGYRFALVGERAVIADPDPATREAWRRLDVRPCIADGTEMASWLTEHGVRAAVIRPDRFVAGTARDAQELQSLTRFLAASAAGMA